MQILNYERISSSPHPRCWMFFIHGFLGTGANWRSFARKLVEAKPTMGAVLIDMRLHGKSQDFLAPHSISSAAQDLIKLAHEFNEPVRAILGHSLGAKVALKFVELFHENLDIAWLLDFAPWASNKKNSSYIYNILDILENLKNTSFYSIQDFVNILKSHNISQEIAQWLAMNLNFNNTNYYLYIDPTKLRDLLDNYYACDLIHVLSKPMRTQINFGLGAKSETLSQRDQTRIASLVKHTHVFENAGHYIHVDSPQELLSQVIYTLRNLE